MQPVFSIINVNFNSGLKLETTVSSILRQSGSFELVIIDGGSTDESVFFAQRLASDMQKRVVLVSEPDKGVYDAMNKGLRLAKGRYILFLGAGDQLLPGALEQVSRLLPSHDRGFLYGDALQGESRYDGPFDWFKLCHKNICHQAIFYGRDVVQLCGEYNLKYRSFADWEMNLRCFGNRSVVKQYMPVVVSNFEAGGISFYGDMPFELDRLQLIRKHLGLLPYLRISMGRRRARLEWHSRRLFSRAGKATSS
jgi:glycosyltransferase involved in cell wall biosynthesis